MDEKLFVVPQTMEEIQNREAPHVILIKRRGKHDTIRNPASQNFAGKGVALDTARGEQGMREAEKVDEQKAL
jgi:hypothetical protein